VDFIRVVQDMMAGSCERGNEPLGSMQDGIPSLDERPKKPLS
jgi:hypothetical protein